MKFQEKGGVSDSFLGFLAVCAHDEYASGWHVQVCEHDRSWKQPIENVYLKHALLFSY